MFTRNKDDSHMIKQDLKTKTFGCRYQLNRPGQGPTPPFLDDPHIRLQKWGANMRTNHVNVEHDLLGASKRLSRDYVDDTYLKYGAKSSSKQFPLNEQGLVEQSRTVMPAWTLRDVSQNRWDTLHEDPQRNSLVPFERNIDSRNLARETHEPSIPTPYQT